MSDNLRNALEKRLGTLPVMLHENRYPVEALPKAELRDLLAAHPAEPASEWTEEERGFVEVALSAADAGNAGHWPTVAAWLALEVRRLRAAGAS